jgi:16S rRNA pseudouridine516 synthase
MFFAKENVTTSPAIVEMAGERCCRLTIYEGKHHQVKRMFARFGIKVVALHRSAIGAVPLDDSLAPGAYRELTRPERLAFGGRF